jgi:hypothetical protein
VRGLLAQRHRDDGGHVDLHRRDSGALVLTMRPATMVSRTRI